jgi:hypothetical protein
MIMRSTIASLLLLAMVLPTSAADVGNRLSYLDQPCDPYYVGPDVARLVTPQWVGEKGVEAVIVLSVDDLRYPKVHEKFLRPILERLKKIDGRAAVSLMTCQVEPQDPQVQAWLAEGVTLDAHTVDHPCPCLQGGNLAKAKDTYDRAVDLLGSIRGVRAVAFRLPCCDSMNSPSPRFFTEVFNRRTTAGRFLTIDSSVFMLYSGGDRSLPRDLVAGPDGSPRFRKYVPTDRLMVNYVEDYPYPYVLGRLCWEVPAVMPSDWEAQHHNGKCSPATVADYKAAVDATVLKQGIFPICFHAHGWIAADQMVELIDYAVARHGGKVKFLNFREVQERLDRNLLGGQPIRAADGGDNGVRVLDLDGDGYMDAVIGNEKVRQTRVWSPEKRQWIVSDFPVTVVAADPQGNRCDAGVRFGVLQKSGAASFLVGNEKAAGVWHFNRDRWIADPRGLHVVDFNAAGVERLGKDLGESSPLRTSLGGRDRGVRMVDLDMDGVSELVVGHPTQQGVFRWSPDRGGWERVAFTLPGGTAFVDAQGLDAGLRLVDINQDEHLDVVFSDSRRCALYLFTPPLGGWLRKVHDAPRGANDPMLPIVRADRTDNGAWFKRQHMYVQNEDKATNLKDEVDARSFGQLLLQPRR